MKFIIVVLLGSFLAVEAAHLNYHRFESEKGAVNWRKPVDF